LSEPGFLTTSLKACACALEQGSRGAGEQGSRGEFKYQVLFPLPLLSLKLVRNAGEVLKSRVEVLESRVEVLESRVEVLESRVEVL